MEKVEKGSGGKGGKGVRPIFLRTLALSKKKLFVKEPLNKIRIIFGGGGHCEYPYKSVGN